MIWPLLIKVLIKSGWMSNWCWSCGCFSCQSCPKLAKTVNFCCKLLFLLMQSMLGSVLPLAIVSWQRWYQILKMFNDVTFEDPRERFAVCFRWVSGDEAIWETRELQFWRCFITFCCSWYHIVHEMMRSEYWRSRDWIFMKRSYEDEEAFWATRDEEIEGALGGVTWEVGTVHVFRHY